MGDKLNEEYFEGGTAAFNYNNVTGGADSASGGSGGSGMDCLQLRTPPEPFHYLISEQAKSIVALQELQNEVGALLEFRDLVIETFPNLRSKMPPSTPASNSRRDWEPGVRVRRKLAAGTDSARAKPQPSVQDSGFSTETSCGKDAHSSASASAASRSRPLEDELWALLDVIQRKGGRLREEAEQLQCEIDGNADTAEESFARAMQACECGDLQRLRNERDALLARAAELEAGALSPSPRGGPGALRSPLGRLDGVLSPNPAGRTPRVSTPDSNKFAAILLESNPVELQRQLLNSTVHNQVLCEQLRRAAEKRSLLLERLERERDANEDLRFRLEEKSIEVESAFARIRQLESTKRGATPERHSSMRDMEPVHIPDGGESRSEEISSTPRRRPSRIPLHTGGKGVAPRPPGPPGAQLPPAPPSRPPSAHSARSGTSRKSSVPVRRSPADNKRVCGLAEYVWRAGRLGAGAAGVGLVGRLGAGTGAVGRLGASAGGAGRARPLPADLTALAYSTPHNLAAELSHSILYENVESLSIASIRRIDSLDHNSLWNNKPQQYFESMNYGAGEVEPVREEKDYDTDSLAP